MDRFLRGRHGRERVLGRVDLREIRGKRRASSGRGLQGDEPAALRDDFLDGGEPEPRPLVPAEVTVVARLMFDIIITIEFVLLDIEVQKSHLRIANVAGLVGFEPTVSSSPSN